ncbi:MAG TPA: hypothetical protein PK514_13980 [Spirochaetota bacterium]|nr:hypothetical protein [Spirochaetota bacterium]
MTKMGTTVILFAAALMICAVPAKTEMVAFPGKIEFRGAINVSGQEIVRRAGIKSRGKGFSVDMDLLKQVLDSNEMISSYNIETANGNLVVTVKEIYPLFIFFVVDKELSVPVLVDDNMNVIISGKFFETDMPIIIVRRQQFDQGLANMDIETLLVSLKQLKAVEKVLCGELQEIEITGENTVRVLLRNRRTRFTMWNSMSGFQRLNRAAALLDQAGRYPDSIDLRDDSVLVK